MSRINRETRELVRARAAFRCEYCHKPDSVSSYPHHIDHIIAVKHGGTSSPENLAWACFQCNSTKSSDIASYDQTTRAIVALFNPRTQLWDEHFHMDGPLIVGRTPTGRATLQALQLNDVEAVEVRASLIKTGLW